MTLVVCPHHGVPPDWNWEAHRVMGRLTITYRFPCCDYTLQVNHLPVPGIHEPLPDASCSHSVHAVGVGTLPLSEVANVHDAEPSNRSSHDLGRDGCGRSQYDGEVLPVQAHAPVPDFGLG